MAEEIYKNLTGKESVHLEDWPKAGEIDKEIDKDMDIVRKICELGHAARKEAKIKVRQPLGKCQISNVKFQISNDLVQLIKDELNVKKVEFKTGKGELKVELDTKMIPELKREGEAREFVRQIQELRKKEGCALDEKIEVFAPSWPAEFEDYIRRETLASTLEKGKTLEIKRSKK